MISIQSVPPFPVTRVFNYDIRVFCVTPFIYRRAGKISNTVVHLPSGLSISPCVARTVPLVWQRYTVKLALISTYKNNSGKPTQPEKPPHLSWFRNQMALFFVETTVIIFNDNQMLSWDLLLNYQTIMPSSRYFPLSSPVSKCLLCHPFFSKASTNMGLFCIVF